MVQTKIAVVEEVGRSKALDVQIGGQHYTRMAIQPMEFSMRHGLNACQHTAIKYLGRYLYKSNPVEDLQKALHCCQLGIELKSPSQDVVPDEYAAADTALDYAYQNNLSIEVAMAIKNILTLHWGQAQEVIDGLLEGETAIEEAV